MARRKVKPTPSIDRSHIVEDTARAGSRCRVRGEAGEYTILADVTNELTGGSWTEVRGGPAGHNQFAAFRPDRIHKVRPPAQEDKHDG